MKIKKKEENIIEIQEEVKISQEDKDIILEKGDRIKVLKEAIPQEKLVRATVWDSPSRNSIPSKGVREYGLRQDDIIGWFATSHNPAGGWLILKASDFDKREFGTEVFRTYSDWTNSTNIIKFNLLTGMYAFVDSQFYSDTDSIRFEKLSKYNRLFIEPTQMAYEEFNIV
jgi:hypothetical protein